MVRYPISRVPIVRGPEARPRSQHYQEFKDQEIDVVWSLRPIVLGLRVPPMLIKLAQFNQVESDMCAHGCCLVFSKVFQDCTAVFQ
jgi:hypothetical protein